MLSDAIEMVEQIGPRGFMNIAPASVEESAPPPAPSPPEAFDG
jgi:hypothetical protein